MNKCYICGSGSYEFLHENIIPLDEIAFWNGTEKQQWCLCKQCGNLYPVPGATKEAIEYRWNQFRKNHLEQDFNLQNHLKKLDGVAKDIFKVFQPYLINKKYILDVGCGYGNLVKILDQQGFYAVGVEMDQSTEKYHLDYGIKSRIGTIQGMEFQHKFDAIFLIYSIYFISDIQDFLLDIKKNLVDDGILCVTMANFLSSENKEMPSTVHAFYPTKESLKKLMASVGLEVLKVMSSRSSIYYIIRKNENIKTTDIKINTKIIYWLYKTKKLRYYTVGCTIRLLKKIKKYINH